MRLPSDVADVVGSLRPHVAYNDTSLFSHTNMPHGMMPPSMSISPNSIPGSWKPLLAQVLFPHEECREPADDVQVRQRACTSVRPIIPRCRPRTLAAAEDAYEAMRAYELRMLWLIQCIDTLTSIETFPQIFSPYCQTKFYPGLPRSPSLASYSSQGQSPAPLIAATQDIAGCTGPPVRSIRH